MHFIGKDMSLLRTFFAIPFPLSAQAELAADVHELQQYVSEDDVRWATAANWHITLQFLQKFDISDFDSLTESVAAVLKEFTAFELKLKNLHFFPNAQHPLVIALQTEPNDILAAMSARIGEVILDHRYAIDNREFHGHLSLARLKDAGTRHFSLPDLTMEHKIKIDTVTFYESKPSKTSSHYESLCDFSLPTKVNK